MKFPPTPNIPKDLLDYLDETFPEKCADPEDSDREIWITVGKREVVKHLKRVYAQQDRKR